MLRMSETAPPRGAIAVTANGPYLVSGEVGLVRRRVVKSEHGEPLTYETTTRVNTGDRFALCRCGQSANKPFCDGSHARTGFDGSEARPAGTYDDRARRYTGTHIVMRDDRSICSHAGFCGNRVTNVWEQLKGSATEDSVARAQVMAMIERCPSGALSYRLAPDGADVEPEFPVQVAVLADGPLFVTGGVAVTMSDGTALETRNRVTLCRCGQSASKPLCDGSHRDAGFADS
jgi:CDGSH-type Zn-finger protein